jgi:NADH-quinone oxidoreductase subunit J
MQIVLFYVAGAAAIGSAIAVVVQRNPFLAALSLILNLASLAALYLVLQGDFVAVAQLLVYAGAVMVMFLFVIAYLGGKADAPWTGQLPVQTIAAIIASGALLVEIVIVIAGQADGHLSKAADITDAFGSPSQIGQLFLTDQLLAFELISVVLLVAAVGGVILGGHSREGSSAEGDDARA